MFFVGEKNSVLVAVCGTSVPDVWEDVVVDVECDAAVVEVVDEARGLGLLEQAARVRAQAGTTSRLGNHRRDDLGMRRV
jgi:hypothetical protein